REVVAEVINRGDAALYGPFPWALAGYTKRADYSHASLGPNYEHNAKKAKELLAAAGYPKGFDMELEWAEFQGWTFNEFVQLVAPGSRGEAAGPAASHLGSPAQERVPHHDDRPAALPHRSGVRPRGREPLLLVPRLLLI